MKCFKVSFDNDTKTILAFAPNSGQAATLFCTWHDFTLGHMPEEFSVERWQASRLTGEQRSLRTAMEAGHTGIGIRDMNDGWIILPPEDERTKS